MSCTVLHCMGLQCLVPIKKLNGLVTKVCIVWADSEGKMENGSVETLS